MRLDTSSPDRAHHISRVSCQKNGATNIWDRHHEIARRVLLGQANIDIAKDLGVTKEMVSMVRNSPVVKDKLACMQVARDAKAVDLAAEIADLAPVALQKLKEALEEGKVNGQQLNAAAIVNVANSILDRDQGKPTQRVETRNLHGHFTIDDINRMKEKAATLGAL